MDLVRETFGEFDVRPVEVPAGGLDVEATDILRDALAGCEACLLRPGRFSREVFDAASALQVIALTGSGVDHVDLAAATNAGVVVANAPGGPGPSVVEHTFGMVFALLHGLVGTTRRVAAGEWADVRAPVVELGGKTLGVVGLGTIGLDVARTARDQFGAAVVGHDPYVTGDRSHPVFPRHDREAIASAGVDLVRKERLFEASDIVSLHTPLTPETRGLVDEAALAWLGGGYLVNTARGGIVDERALREALVDGELAGAALDVFDEEPPDPDDPLLDAPNLVLSPHVAGVSDRTQRRGLRIAATSVRQVLDGALPDTVVNPAVYDE